MGRAAVPADSRAAVFGRANHSKEGGTNLKGKRGKNRATIGGHGGPPY